MNVLVIGAAGKTGSLVVERALAAGHRVTAFARDASASKAATGVSVFAGDATDRAALDKAMVGQDAVIDTIGGKTPYRGLSEFLCVRRVEAGRLRQGIRQAGDHLTAWAS